MQDTLADPESVFQLLHPLGRGSYGAVYKSRVIKTGELVAVKIIPLAADDEIESIQREIAMLRDCQHANIVKYYGSFKSPDSLWIVMEYCAGGSVSDIMHVKGSGLSEELIKYIVGETLAGLTYLHSVGKVHRDIKCGNILLTENGEVKLADFGVAAQLTNTMSKRNTFIGTPHWMAPEVIQISHYDGKVDVWALGITAVEMAERYPPRWKVNPNRVIFMIVKDPPPRLSDMDRWSLTFQDFIAQCLQKDVLSRPTAKYLQQHRFVSTDKAEALRALQPLIQNTRTYMAELAAASDGQTGGSGVDRGTVAMDGTVRRAATVQTYGATMIAQPRAAEPEPAEPVGGTFLRHDVEQIASSLQQRDAPPSGDYSAALGAISDFDNLDLIPAVNAPWLTNNPKARSDVRKLKERLHNIYTSGAVVPLPFLRASDACPLALIGRAGGGAEPPSEEVWEGVLRKMLAEEDDFLPEALRQRILQSSSLLNLVKSLAYHEDLLAEPVELSPKLRDHLRSRAEDIRLFLRTVLCI
ncbi:hypothetical protein QBZ16_004050 [Prototheca wickerhamii]|uniref:non-specific serine/threonine protein kinase n=1 Tax=Prototheca wickerhamii TaxID=3111 RepID=A0AAD9MIC2_PROWI|nr:hypothetical protein QBZ16_004050 [Prototheca wickerhamii]